MFTSSKQKIRQLLLTGL